MSLLNNATQAWLEQEYHHRKHLELGCSPIQRYLDDPNVGRSSPNSLQLRQAFRQQVKRKQRRSDGTISLAGRRFEIPSRYRRLETVFVQYARWDLTQIALVDSQDNSLLCRLYPLDKSENATGKRRVLEPDGRDSDAGTAAPAGIAPLQENLMADYAATGLPPAYIPQDNMKPDQQEEKQ